MAILDELVFNPRFQKRFDAHDYGQSVQLEKAMLADLTSEPVVYWTSPSGQKEPLDGHHRVTLALKHKLDIQLHEKHFENEDAAYLWVLRNQCMKRNLTEYDRNRALKECVELETKQGKSMPEAVKDAAELTGVSERTVYRAIEEKTPVQQFFEGKKVYERDLERVTNKEVEKLKQKAVKENWSEDQAESEWETIDAAIQSQFADRSAALEAASVEIQAGAEASGVKASGGGKRRKKKSAERNRAIRLIKGYLAKIEELSFHFGEDFVPIDFAACAAWIAKIEPVKARFGR